MAQTMAMVDSGAGATVRGRVLSVNVGGARTIRWLGKTITTGIWKSPVEGRVAVVGVNVAGDDQANRQIHGGPDKAVYAYAREDADWWENALGRPVEPGGFGENLTLSGVDVTRAVIGERWEIGTTVLEVAQPRFPCVKLGARMKDPGFPRRFAAAGRLGAYLRIIREGDVGAGDEVRIAHRPAHRVTINDVGVAYLRDNARAERLLDAPELAERWRQWAVETLASQKAGKGSAMPSVEV